jgi:hypothetical protein
MFQLGLGWLLIEEFLLIMEFLGSKAVLMMQLNQHIHLRMN